MTHRLVPRLSLSFLALAFSSAPANPVDPNPSVISGQVDFAGLNTADAIITQGSQQAIVDYSHFNIPEGSSVQFLQPNSTAAILNRITGADPSLINGSLTANGQVYFVNPAGVTFGPNSVVRADVFMAAAGQISNEDFLNGINRFSLDGNVLNEGSIRTEKGVGLFGQQVQNNGELVAKNGYAIVAAGDEVHVRQGGTGLSVDVTDAAKNSKSGTAIQNLGSVDGEEVMFSAGDAFATAIQQSGTVRAKRSARVYSDGGKVEVTGEIVARNDSGQGGRIEVGGTDKGAATAPSASGTTIASSAKLDASSDSGKGGHIVVWSEGHTRFNGVADATSRSGPGGFIEGSGATINFDNLIESILLGPDGHFLLDPTNVEIDGTLASSIETMLIGGTDVSIDTNAVGPDAGDITVISDISVPTNNSGDKGTLTLTADRDIVVGSGVVIENVQEDFMVGETVFDFIAGRDIILNGDVRHSGIGGETGRGSILLTAGNELLVNNTLVDSNGGSIVVDADTFTLTGSSALLSAGLIGENTAGIDVTATSRMNFSGGRFQTFGGADVFIDTARLTNNTGNSAISRGNLAESFFAIRLPNPTGNGSGGNHLYNGLTSGTRANYNVADLSTLKAGGITNNGYFFELQPTIDITANNGSKIYGNTFPLPTGGSAVSVDTTDFVPVPFGNPFLQDTVSNSLNLGGVTTSSAGADVTANAGTAPITPAGAFSNNGYAINHLDGTLTINQRAVTLTASQQNKQYGDVLTLDTTAFTVLDTPTGGSTLPNGNVINSVGLDSATGVNLSTTEDAAPYSDEIDITGQSGIGGFDAANYSFTYLPGDLVVDRRNVTVTASEQSKFYGDILDLDSNASQTAFTILDNGLTNGGDALLPNSETINTVSLQSNLPVDVAASQTEGVGTYSDELEINGVSGGPTFDVNNYNLTFEPGDLVVAARPITLTPSDQTKEYGEVLPLGTSAFTVVDNGLTNGGDNALPNGEQIDSVTLLSSGGFAASTDADVSVNPGDIGIDQGSFGSANGSNGFNAGNYDITFETGALTIDPRQIELIASRQEKFYGDDLDLDNSSTAFTIVDQGNALDSSLPNGETIDTVTMASVTGVDSSPTSDAALYSGEIAPDSPVTGSPGTGDGFLESNYDITYTSGDLLVNPRPITVTPVQQEKTYGDTYVLRNDNTAFTILDNGLTDGGDAALPNGELLDTVTLVSQGGHDNSTTSDAVLYSDDLQITGFGSGSNGFDPANYNFDFSNQADFLINRRAAQINANAQQKDYGDFLDLGNTAFTVIDRDGGALPNGEVVETITLVSDAGVAASTDADAGTYVDNISVTPTSTGTPTIAGSPNFNQENYTFSYGTAGLTINQRAITLTAAEQDKIYGNELALNDTAFATLDKDGDAILPNGEVITNVTINSATGIDALTSADVASYEDEIVISGPVTGTPGTGDGFLESNYDITYVEGDLRVDPRAITVSPTRQEKIYGNTLTLDQEAFTVVDLDGDGNLPNNESIDTVNVISQGGHDASTTSGAVTYTGDLEITSVATSSNNFDLNNYIVDLSNRANFVINRRAVTLAANEQVKDYGDPLTLDTTAFTLTDLDGDTLLPNSETIDTVTLVSGAGVDASTDADAGRYNDEISITPTSTGTPTLAGSNGFDQENYTFSYDTGDLVVNQRAITLTAAEQDKIYGNELALNDTAFATLDKDGDAILPNGEVITNVTINSATGIDALTSADVASYEDEIVISGPVTGTPGTGDGFLESNYDITYVEGDLRVDPRAITVSPTRQEKIYGNTLTLDQEAFTVVDLDGDGNLPNNESIDTVNVISQGGHDASTTSGAVTYTGDLEITSVATSSNNFDLNNYIVDLSNRANFVINRRAVTLAANEQVKDYGDPLTLDTTAFTLTDLDGDTLLPNSETIDTVTLVSGAGVDASTDADAGRYNDEISITPTSTGTPTLAGSNGFDQENYTFSYDTGDLVVNQRAITLTAAEQDKIYGNELALNDTAFATLDKDGDAILPNGEVITNVTINSATGIDALTSADVASYEDEIVISGPVTGTPGTGDGFLESNYDITYVEGDLRVDQRAITLTALPQGRTYGESEVPATNAFSVLDLDGDALLPNGESIDTMTITSNVAGNSSAAAGSYTDDLAPTDILTSTGGFNESNYNVTRVNGDYTIDRRAILLTALDQEKIYGNSEILDPEAFSLTDTFGGGGAILPNGEVINTVVFDPTTVPGDSTASAGVYTDEVGIADQVGSSGFVASNYDISYAPADYTVSQRAIEVVISDDKRFAAAEYTIDPTAFTVIDLDSDNLLPNGETIDSLGIVSVTNVAEDPRADIAVYPAELDADPSSALGSNGFDLGNYDITVTPGDFEIEAFPGLGATIQDTYLEQWIRENIGYDPEDPFAHSYAISQSVGLRLLTLPSWNGLSSSKKKAVLSALDAVPLHLQSINLVEELIQKTK